MWKTIKNALNKNWKIVVAIIIGIILGGFFLGNVTGISIIRNGLCITILIHRNMQLPKNMDISGDWVYKATAIGEKSIFTEDSCQTRFGTAYIVRKADGYELNIIGKRKAEDGCLGANGNKVIKNDIPWISVNAMVSINNKMMFLWLQTGDPVPRYAYISELIIQNENDVKPVRMEGTMYYLEQLNKTWIEATIDFYRSGTKEADAIKKKWSDTIE